MFVGYSQFVVYNSLFAFQLSTFNFQLLTFNYRLFFTTPCSRRIVVYFTCPFFLFLSFSFVYRLLCIGKVNLKSQPSPTRLSTHILPPCFSTNSLQSIRPKPVPFSFSVPFLDVFLVMLNK